MLHTDETKALLSEMRTGSANPFYGKTHTAEAKARIAKSSRLRNQSRTYEPAPQRVTIPADPCVIAYLAGMVDADGSIRFKTDHSTSTKVRRPFLSVYNTSRPLMDWLMETFSHGCTAKGNMGREQVQSWTIQGARDVYALVTAIRPYLIVKKSDADTALEHLRGRYGWD